MTPMRSALLLVVGVIAAGCGATNTNDNASTGGGSGTVTSLAAPGTTGTPGAAGTSVQAPGSTSTTAAVPADPKLVARAEKGVLAAADFPSPWARFEPTPTAKSSVTPCFDDATKAIVSAGAASAGPIMKFGDQPMFVSSVGYSFPDEASAKAFTTAANSAGVEQCVLVAAEKAQSGRDLTSTVASDKAVFEGREAEVVVRHEDAAGTLVGAYLVDFYRVGNSVVEVIVEYGGTQDFDAAWEHMTASLSKAYERLDAAD